MSLHSVSDPGQSGQPPKTGNGESAVSAMLSAIGDLLAESELAREQFQEARHDQARAAQFDLGAATAARQVADARARAVAERHKAGPHKRVNRHVGTALAAGLAALDAVPAYWSAEAFGLGQTATLFIAALLCAALAGAMWLLDLFVDRRRRLAVRGLGIALGVGFAGMFALRTNYLMVTQGSGTWSAAIQALALTGLSASLVAVGFVLLSHRVPRAAAEADSAARQAQRLHDRRAGADLRASAAMSRAAFADTVLGWVLGRGPSGLGHEQLIRAANEAITVLLSQ